jgi:hypothetical protein
MVQKSKRTLTCLAGILGVMLLYCTKAPVAGGLETTNGIAVRIVSGEMIGHASAPARIIICDTAFTPLEGVSPKYIDSVYSGENGSFTVTGLPPGTYTLIGQTADLTGGCVIKNLPVDPATSATVGDSAHFVPLASLTVVAQTDSHPQYNTQVFIRGTAFYATTDAQGTCSISNIPTGTYRVEAHFIKKGPTLHLYTATGNNVVIGGTGNNPLHLDLVREF